MQGNDTASGVLNLEEAVLSVENGKPLLLVVEDNREMCIRDRVRPLDLEQGLSCNYVVSIAQDKYGFLWFATEEGLNLSLIHIFPAKWIKTSRRHVLNIYSDNNAYANLFKTDFG